MAGQPAVLCALPNIQGVFDSKEHRTTLDGYDEPYEKSPLHIDPREWIKFTVYFSDVPRLTKEHGVLVGEVLHNFRGALDHLAWDLVRLVGKENLTSKEREAIYFPLTKSSRSYWGTPSGSVESQARRKLPGVPENPYLTLIETYQPYRRSTAGRMMRSLRNLSDIDKHRVVVPTMMVPQKGHFNVDFDWGDIVDWEPLLRRGHAVKPGTKFGRFTVARIAPNQPIQMRVKGRVRSEPIFLRSYVSPPPGADGSTIMWVLEGISKTCLEILNKVEGNL